MYRTNLPLPLLLLLLPLLHGSVIPRDPNGDGHIDILLDERLHHENDGNFGYRYETENGIKNRMAGQNGADGGTIMSGEYSYISPEGDTVHVQWTADENGYHPIVKITPADVGDYEDASKGVSSAPEAASVIVKQSLAPPTQEKVVRKRSHSRYQPKGVTSRGRNSGGYYYYYNR